MHGYNVTEWMCILDGIVTPEGDCIFCHDLVDDMSHFVMHDVHDCLGKNSHERTFARKDLLKQHIQQKHLAGEDKLVLKTFQIPQAWSKEDEVMSFKSEALWCGFCPCMCDSVRERMYHVAEHFQDGYDISFWIPLMTT
jgi:hypothetical protein